MLRGLAVLPFDDLSADQSLGYLGDGAAEDIITALSRFPDTAVVARTSSFAYKGKAVDIRQVGNELGVDYWSKAAYARTATSFKSYLSSSTRRMASIFGPSVLTGLARTHGHSKTRSLE